MGLSSTSQKSETTPTFAPQLTAAAGQVTNAYNANEGKVQGYADQVGSLVPSLLDKYNQGNPAINAQTDYISRTLADDPGHNPQLEAMLQQSDQQVGNQTAASLGTRGISPAGSVAHDVVSRNIAQNDTQARAQDYYQQQAHQAQVAGMAPSNAAGGVIGITPLLSAAETAGQLPGNVANQYGAGIGGLLGAYKNTTQTNTPSLADSAGKAIKIAGSIASLFSDKRLKEDIRRIGQTDGGVPLYAYKYKGGGPVHIGVMAQELAELQPEALGPEVLGYMTVNYGEVR